MFALKSQQETTNAPQWMNEHPGWAEEISFVKGLVDGESS